MSGSSNRRTSTRILTAFSLVLTDADGEIVDERAIAHDLSEKGFKLETQAALKKDQTVGYRLELSAGGEIKGHARIVWVQRTDLSNWGGAEFTRLTRDARKRVRREISPSDVDWGVIADKALVALVLILAVSVIGAGLNDFAWRRTTFEVFPQAVAIVAMGWSLLELVRPWR